MADKIEYTDEDVSWMVFMPPRESVTDYSKFSATQARDDQGRWTDGGSFTTYATPSEFFAANPNGNVFYEKADYNDRKAMEGYQNDGYIAVNQSLRSGEPVEPYLQANIDRIDHLIEVAPPLANDTILFRGLKNNPENGLDIRTFEVGTVLTDKGFTSTSADKGFAEKWANNQDTSGQNYVMSIQAPTGTKGVITRDAAGGTDLGFDYEAEFLMPRNTGLEITAINHETRTIEARIVNG